MHDNPQKQQFLIETLISDPTLFTICNDIIKASYFLPEFQNSVKFILKYSETYNNVPTPDLIEAESQVVFKTREITKDIFEYSCTEIETFCKYMGFRTALSSSIPLMEKNDLDGCLEIIKESLLISLEKDLGTDYFLDPEARLKNMIDNQNYQSSGYTELDELLGGGIVRGQMIVFSGNSGAGKSMTLSNVGLNLLEAGLNVLYLTLELSEDLVAQRYDGLISGQNQKDWEINSDNTVRILKDCSDSGKYGSMFIKYMNSGTNANTVKSYLKEYEIKNNMIPDVILLDYLDIAGTNKNIGNSDVTLKDKYVSEEFRNLANEYNTFLITASQQNRGAIGVMDPTQAHVAGGLSKVQTADFWFSIIATDEMKEEGIVRYQCIKARSSDGVGKSVTLEWLPGSSRISNLDPSGTKSRPVNPLLAKKITRPTLNSADTVVKQPTVLKAVDDPTKSKLLQIGRI